MNELVMVTLPRPLGVMLQWNEGRSRAVVSELVSDSNAEQRVKVRSDISPFE